MESPIMVDERSGFCKSNSVFYSKRKPILLPQNPSLDVTTFVSSHAHACNVAFIDAATARHVTFPELWRAVDSVAECLSGMGISKGNVVLILSPNSVSFAVVSLAVMSLGAVITTTNPLNTPREIAKQIANSRPVLAFTTAPLVSKIVDSTHDLSVVLMDDDNVSRSPRIVSTLNSMLRKEPSERRVRHRVDQDDMATLLYSSGTTGESKGVISSHKNMIAMVQTILTRFDAVEEEEGTFLCTVPMFHIYGLAAMISLLCSGSTVVILSRFEIDDMLSAIEKYKVTYLPLVPPIMLVMLNGAESMKARYDLSSIRTVSSAGAPLSKEVIEGFVEKFPGVDIMQGYGLTESTGTGSSTDSLEESRVYGTAGLLSPSMEAKIVDPESGEAYAVNKVGELWLKGPGIMKGTLFLLLYS